MLGLFSVESLSIAYGCPLRCRTRPPRPRRYSPSPCYFLRGFRCMLFVVCCTLQVVYRVLSVALQDAAQPGRNSLADTLGGPPRAAVSADNGPPPYLALSSSAVSVPSAVSSSFTGAVRTSLQLPDLRRPYAWTVGQVKETAHAIGAPHRTGGTQRYLSTVGHSGRCGALTAVALTSTQSTAWTDRDHSL